MGEFECRLCSATTSLISLFNGKNRKNRDIIRKLTAETVNIQFADGDVYACICYSCVVQVYNIYIFQVRSQENDKRLQEFADSHKKPYSGKHIIIPLEYLYLPSIDDLKEKFTPWLEEKLQAKTEEQEERNTCSNIETSSNTCSESNSKNAESQTEVLKKDQGVQISSSTETKESQCDIRVPAGVHQKHKSIQCGNFLGNKNVRIQVEPRTRKQSVQCCLQIDNSRIHEKAKKSSNPTTTEKYSQCDILIERDMRLKKGFSKQDQTVQCNLKFGTVEKGCQYEKNEKHYNTISTQTHREIHNPLKPLLKTLSSKNSGSKFGSNDDKFRQKELANAVNPKLQFLANTGLKSNGIRYEKDIQSKGYIQYDIHTECCNNLSNVQSKVLTYEIGLQTDSFTSIYVDGSVQTDLQLGIGLKNMLSDTKNETKTELFSPVPSPTKSLNISVDMSCKNETSSPISSPSSKCLSSNLLEPTKKVNVVKVCRECDYVTYSVAEAKIHKKLHKKCKLCKKVFRSIKKTKEHFKTQCDTKLTSMIAKVTLVRLDGIILSSHLKKLQRVDFTTHTGSVRNSETLPPPEKKKKL